MGKKKIAVLNLGSTSTKVAYYEDTECIFSENLKHSSEDLTSFNNIFEQKDYRTAAIRSLFDAKGIDLNQVDSVVSRGGNMAPREGGVYKISAGMIEECRSGLYGSHPTCLGPEIALELSKEGCLPLTVDPPTTDEFEPLARYSGIPEISRISSFQALNQRAVGKKYAEKIGKSYDELNLVVIMLGGGISVVAHKGGRMIDGNNALDGDGPFSTNRSGGLPVGSLINMCFSGEYTKEEVVKKINGKGGLTAYVGDNDVRNIEERSKTEPQCLEVLEAMCYQTAKEVGAAAAVLSGNVDAILISGGMAHSDMIVKMISDRVKFIAPIDVFPGEFEMETLATNAYQVLCGNITPKEI